MNIALVLAGAGVALFAASASRRSGIGVPGHGDLAGDPYAEKDLATGCDPSEKPGVQKFRALILRLFGGEDLGISRACGDGSPRSEHEEGRAWDWAPPSTEAAENVFLMLSGNRNETARRAGLMYWIYRGESWRSYPHDNRPAGAVGPSESKSEHADHVHFSFSRAGAAGETSLYRS